MFNRQGRNICQFFSAHYSTGRIRRISDENRSGFVRQPFFNIFRGDFKIIGFVGRDMHWFAFSENNTTVISNKRRVGKNHFIAGFYKRAHCQVERLTDADGN